MKAMILAAGLGTRLKPWTQHHPKALVPVEGVPMLKRVIERLKTFGLTELVVNVHHFAEQVEEFLSSEEWGVKISVSDERKELLDTGGALLHAAPLLTRENDEPFLVHNVDILSNIDLGKLMSTHRESGTDVTLAIGDRGSSRHLVFGSDMQLKGWRNLTTGEIKPSGFRIKSGDVSIPFSGIYAASSTLLDAMARLTDLPRRFSIIDFLLSESSLIKKGFLVHDLPLLDIGKPDSLAHSSEFLKF